MTIERDSPAADDSAPGAVTPAQPDDDIEVVIAEEDPPAATTIAGADGMPGGDADPEPEPVGDAEPKPKSRFARQREKLKTERDHAIQAAIALQQRVQAAEQHNAAVAQHNAALQHQVAEGRYAYLKAVEANLGRRKQEALGNGDAAAIATIDAESAQLGAALFQAEQQRQNLARMPAPQQVQQRPVPQQLQQRPQAPQQLHPAAARWAEHHGDWLDSDPRNIQVARTVGRALEEQGFGPDSPDYYARLNRGIETFVPDFRSDFNPAAARSSASAPRGTGSAVAGVNRASSDGNRQTSKVTLTAQEIALCERNGLDPKSYAREKLLAASARR